MDLKCDDLVHFCSFLCCARCILRDSKMGNIGEAVLRTQRKLNRFTGPVCALVGGCVCVRAHMCVLHPLSIVIERQSIMCLSPYQSIIGLRCTHVEKMCAHMLQGAMKLP